jgi:hypothetical protein
MDRRIRFSHARHDVDLGRGDRDRSDCGFSLSRWSFAMRHPKTADRFTIQLAAPMILGAALLLAMIVELAQVE